MSKYNPVTPEVLEELKKIVGEKNVKTDEETLEHYKTDEETDPKLMHRPEVVVWAESTEQVAAVMKLANKYVIPVTPRSAGTSVSDGAIPTLGGIVLSLEKMDKILEINADAMYAVVEAGARTIDIQQAAHDKGMLYAGDPCSAESCLIGGNIATNAGGNKAVRYGTTRDQIYAVEVVTPTGDITNLGARLKKKTTGYCLEQLIMGSEGTLGIITKATLKLLPLAPYKVDVAAVYDDLDKAVTLVPSLLKAGLEPTSVEFMDHNFLKSSCDYSEIKLPHYENENACYLIVSMETFSEDDADNKMEKLAEICENSGAIDVLEADDRVWTVRKNCLESTRSLSKVAQSDDLVVPVDKLAQCIEHLMEEAKKFDFTMFCLAHAGDGNLHFLHMKGDMSDEEWVKQEAAFHAIAYPYVYSLGGRISGEHGIGAKKVDALETYTDPVELKMMDGPHAGRVVQHLLQSGDRSVAPPCHGGRGPGQSERGVLQARETPPGRLRQGNPECRLRPCAGPAAPPPECDERCAGHGGRTRYRFRHHGLPRPGLPGRHLPRQQRLQRRPQRRCADAHREGGLRLQGFPAPRPFADGFLPRLPERAPDFAQPAGAGGRGHFRPCH